MTKGTWAIICLAGMAMIYAGGKKIANEINRKKNKITISLKKEES